MEENAVRIMEGWGDQVNQETSYDESEKTNLKTGTAGMEKRALCLALRRSLGLISVGEWWGASWIVEVGLGEEVTETLRLWDFFEKSDQGKDLESHWGRGRCVEQSHCPPQNSGVDCHFDFLIKGHFWIIITKKLKEFKKKRRQWQKEFLGS